MTGGSNCSTSVSITHCYPQHGNHLDLYWDLYSRPGLFELVLSPDKRRLACSRQYTFIEQLLIVLLLVYNSHDFSRVPMNTRHLIVNRTPFRIPHDRGEAAFVLLEEPLLGCLAIRGLGGIKRPYDHKGFFPSHNMCCVCLGKMHLFIGDAKWQNACIPSHSLHF